MNENNDEFVVEVETEGKTSKLKNFFSKKKVIAFTVAAGAAVLTAVALAVRNDDTES